MKKLFRTLALLMAGLLAVYMIGCGGDDDDEDTAETPDATITSSVPANGGTLASNGTITITFDNAPGDVTVSPGTAKVEGKKATISGPFTEGALALAVSWTNGDGSETLNFTVTAADTDPPTITGGTVEDGEEDVDPETINTDGIEIEFSEDVTGSIALQTDDGKDLRWEGGKVEGNKAKLTKVAGAEIGNETTYVIAGKVSDAAGNDLEVSVTFITKGKE